MCVLILSCNTGEGHNSSAQAIKEVFEAKGETCAIEDSLRFISEKTSQFISWGHVFVYRRLPWLFNWGYQFTEKHPASFSEKSGLYNFFAKGSDELCGFIVEGGYDAVVCVHPFAALMLSETQKRYQLPIKTAFVATDYTCSPSVQECSLNYCFIPDEALTDAFECANIPRETIVPSGIPIRQMFYRSLEKEEAKRMLGVAPHHKHMVMMCGSMGCGPIKKLAGLLTEQLQEGFDLSVVCGTNEQLKHQLERKYGERKNLHIHGYVEDMSAMLDSADLYLTKAGGISVTEAATKKVPMVFIRAVAGCEEYNSTFHTQRGCAVEDSDLHTLVQLCISLMQDESRYNAMAAAAAPRHWQNASECIFDTLSGG